MSNLPNKCGMTLSDECSGTVSRVFIQRPFARLTFAAPRHRAFPTRHRQSSESDPRSSSRRKT
jgi:hypothetical protein